MSETRPFTLGLAGGGERSLFLTRDLGLPDFFLLLLLLSPDLFLLLERFLAGLRDLRLLMGDLVRRLGLTGERLLERDLDRLLDLDLERFLDRDLLERFLLLERRLERERFFDLDLERLLDLDLLLLFFDLDLERDLDFDRDLDLDRLRDLDLEEDLSFLTVSLTSLSSTFTSFAASPAPSDLTSMAVLVLSITLL